MLVSLVCPGSSDGRVLLILVCSVVYSRCDIWTSTNLCCLVRRWKGVISDRLVKKVKRAAFFGQHHSNSANVQYLEVQYPSC